MALPNPCTVPDAHAEIDRTVAYEGDPTGQMCQDFITACRWLLARRASQWLTSQRADTRFQTVCDTTTLRDLMATAQRWLASLDVGAAYEAATIPNRASLPRQFGLNQMREGC